MDAQRQALIDRSRAAMRGQRSASLGTTDANFVFDLIEIIGELVEIVEAADLPRSVDVRVHHTFDGPLTVLVDTPVRPAVTARLSIKAKDQDHMNITIDTTNEVATLEYVDDHGDVTTAPDGVTATFTSDNDAVATIDPTTGAITPVGLGTVNIGATVTNADGSPFGDPIASVAVEVDPGAAVGARLSVGPAAG